MSDLSSILHSISKRTLSGNITYEEMCEESLLGSDNVKERLATLSNPSTYIKFVSYGELSNNDFECHF